MNKISLIILLVSTMCMHSAQAASWDITKGKMWPLCQDLHQMLMDLPDPKILVDGELIYSDKYPKIKPIPKTLIKDYKPWLPLLEQYIRYIANISLNSSDVKKLGVEGYVQRFLTDIKTSYENNNPVLYRGDFDIDADGSRNNVLWLSSTFDKFRVVRIENLTIYTSGQNAYRYIVFDKNKQYLSLYNKAGGHGFYYDGRIRFVSWGGGVFAKNGRPRPDPENGEVYHTLRVSDVYKTPDLFSDKILYGKKQVCEFRWKQE